MKRLFVFVCLLGLLVLLTGCDDRTPAQVSAKNITTLAGEGEVMGKLPDGREVRRYRIDIQHDHDHWIYVVGDAVTVSVNHSVQQGKTTTNNVEVFVGGVKYVPEVESGK